MIADMAGVPLYVVHTSCEEAHEAIRRARQAGKRVWGEPLIQHLVLDESEYFHPDWDHAARRVMSPPFRNKLHQDSLWAGLQSGSLSCVATDHCAFTTEQKRFGLKSFAQIPNGTGGLEDRMPVLWTHGVNTGRLTPNEFVAVTSTNIAKILNLYPKKGAVLVGADADLVVWDPAKEKTIGAASQQSKIDYNVFEGQKVKGLPRYTLTRGRVAVEDGKVNAQEGWGQFVGRAPKPAVNRALSGLERADRAPARQPQRHSGDGGVMKVALITAGGSGMGAGGGPRPGRRWFCRGHPLFLRQGRGAGGRTGRRRGHRLEPVGARPAAAGRCGDGALGPGGCAGQQRGPRAEGAAAGADRRGLVPGDGGLFPERGAAHPAGDADHAGAGRRRDHQHLDRLGL